MFRMLLPQPARACHLGGGVGAGRAAVSGIFVAADWGDPTGLAGLVGVKEKTVWVYLYVFLAYAAFAAFWMWYRPHRWSLWSVAGAALIVFVTWFQVQLDVMINEWFGRFYDTIQKALAKPGAVTIEDYYGQLATFLMIAMVFIVTAVLSAFFTSHFVFRWRTAMNERYVDMWQKRAPYRGRLAARAGRHDALRQHHGNRSASRFIDAVMTLIAFLPILWGLSVHIKEIPVVGEVAYALVWGRHTLVGVRHRHPGAGRLPPARARVPQPAGRGRLPQGARHRRRPRGPGAAADAGRAVRQCPAQLFSASTSTTSISTSSRYGYLPGRRHPALYRARPRPSFRRGFTLGAMQQIIRAFGRVENSFQFLVNSWTTIVELMSIYKRLAAFERAIAGNDLAAIEFETGTRLPTG